MLRGLFRLLLFVVAIVLIYNYFLGDAKERKQSEEIVSQVKSLGKSMGDLLVAEKDKLQQGKYDEALEKVGDFIKNLRSNSDQLDVDGLRKLNELEAQKIELQSKMEAIDGDGYRSTEEEEELKNDWQRLILEMESFLKDQKQG